MSQHDHESSSILDAADNLQEREKQLQIDFISEGCTVLGGILRQLCLREASLSPDDGVSPDELLRAASDVTAVLGLERYITVHEYRHETAEEFRERTIAARKEAGLSQADFGELTGLGSRFVVNRIERGKEQLTEQRKAHIYKSLGINPNELGPK